MGLGRIALAGYFLFEALRDHAKESRPVGQLGDAGGSTPSIRTKEVRNIDERVAEIVKLIQKGGVDASVYTWTVGVVSRRCGDRWCTPEKDNEAEVIAVFDAVRKDIRYVRDPYGQDLFSTASRTLERHGGDCDDFTVVLGSALRAIGYQVAVRVIQTTDSEDFNHVYLLVNIDGRWVALDASMDYPAGWECPRDLIRRAKDYVVP